MTIDRSAISRAWFFLALAEKCSLEQRNEFEAFVEASILFARTAILRTQCKFERKPQFQSWWQDLLQNQKREDLRR